MLTSLCSNKFLFALRLHLVLIIVSLSSCDYISRRILTKPVVQVDQLRMSTQEFSQELASRLKDFDSLAAKDPKVLAVHRDQIVNDFIISAVIELWFNEMKLSLSKEALEAEIKKVSSTYPTDSSFREALNEAGLSFGDWSRKMESVLKKKILLDHLRKDLVAPTESQLTSYYNENRLRYEQKEALLLSHILVSDENQSEIVMKLLRRQKFSDLSPQYSSAYQKETGDIFGWIEKGYLIDLDRGFRMRIGDILGPIKMSEGIHIFKINDKRLYKVKTFTEARTEVVADVLALREQALFSAWLEEQFKKYSIKKNKAVLDSIKIETQ